MTIDLNVLGVLMKGGAVQDKSDGVIISLFVIAFGTRKPSLWSKDHTYSISMEALVSYLDA